MSRAAAPSTTNRLRRTAIGMAAAAAAALAVLTPIIGPAPAAPAAALEGVADIHPTPQEISAEGIAVSLDGEVTIVVGDGADGSAVEALEEIVADAGGTATVSATPTGDGVEVYLGTTADNAPLVAALAALGVDSAAGLVEDGYVIASGTYDGGPALVLNGVDDSGTYYATQTLRQVVADGTVPAMQVRDWPLMPIRGTIEGFYGIPWSHQARLDLLEFSGHHKLNTYIYTPKDDLLLRANWRELYEGDELARMDELVAQANQYHVNFTFALSPGADICYSSEEDFDATIAKFEQLRDLGVDSFYIALDDIPLRLNCAQDEERFTEPNWFWLADAQTYYLNRVQTEWIEPNGLDDLQIVPTNYAGSEEDPYKGRLGDFLDDDIRVQWTGEGVFSDTITVESVARAAQTYRTDHLYIWDNFPVNDGRRDRLFLNPLTGRAPGLYEYIDGITSNPMIQPYASWPALANYADYTWNPLAYDPEASMANVLTELAGDDPEVLEALIAFVDLNQSWPYREDTAHAPMLSADVEAFWDAYEGGDEEGRQALVERLELIESLPVVLADMAEPGFYADAEPWIDAASQWAAGLLHEITMLAAIEQDNGARATEALLAAQEDIAKTQEPTVDDQGGDGVLRPDEIVPSVGDGVFGDFSDDALAVFTAWLGAEPAGPPAGYPATASSSMGTHADNVVENMVDGDYETLYWSNEAAEAGDWVQVDLGEAREVGRIAVHQADADDQGGDMIYSSTLQYSLDGESWTDIASYGAQALITADLDEPVMARYVRLIADESNAGGQWVKIREFVVSSASNQFETNLPSAEGEGVSRAFDGDVATAYQADEAPVEGSFIAHNFTETAEVGSVTVVGTGSGTIEVSVGGEWIEVGELTEGAVFHEASVDVDGPVAGVRLVFEAGSDAPRIIEVVTREGGPIGVPEPEPTEEPTTDQPTEEPTTDRPTEEPTTDRPTDEPTTDRPTGGVDPTDDSSTPGTGGGLPSTGATGSVGAMLAATGLLLAGAAGLLRTRRRMAASE